MVFLGIPNTSPHIFGNLITHVFSSWEMCTAWLIGSRSASIIYDVQIETFFRMQTHRVRHHYCILNHKNLLK